MILFVGCSKKQISKYDEIIIKNLRLYDSQKYAESSDIGAIIQNFNIMLYDSEIDEIIMIIELKQCYTFFISDNPIADWYVVIPSDHEIIVFDCFFDDYVEYDIAKNNDPSGFRYRFAEISKKFLHKISEVEYDRTTKKNN